MSKNGTYTVRWAIKDSANECANRVARYHGVRPTALVNYLLEREDAALFGGEEPVAPWVQPIDPAFQAAPSDYGYRNDERYIGGPGPKYSLAWAAANDTEFSAWLDSRVYSTITTKELIDKVLTIKQERPRDFSRPYTSVTLTQLVKILISRGQIMRIKKGQYGVLPGVARTEKSATGEFDETDEAAVFGVMEQAEKDTN